MTTPINAADHTRLVYHMLKGIRMPKSVDPEEVACAGFEALVKAAQLFDPSKGYQFSTYACQSVFREMVREVELLTRLRGSKKARQVSMSAYSADAISIRQSQAAVDCGLDAEAMEDLLQPHERWLLRQHFILDRTFLEVGRDIGVSGGWAAKLTWKVVEKVRRAWGVRVAA